MAKPKLALIPAAQGSKFYSVLPSSGVGDFDFTRSGSATRINSQGLIETVGNGVSRLNYPLIDGKVVGCPHHILEPQRTNLITYSEDFSTFSLGSNTEFISSSILSPSGELNAYKYKSINSIGFTYIVKNVSVSDNTTHTFSVWARADNPSNITVGKICQINMTNGGGASFVDVSELTTEWKRFSVTATSAVSSTAQCFLATDWSVGGEIEFWAAQLEQGSYPTSYIPTNGSSVTRSAETANGSGDASTFNDSEGVLMAEISALDNDGTRRSISINDGSSANRFILRFGNTDNTIEFIAVSNTSAVLLSSVTVPNTLSSNKVAAKWNSNNYVLYINGIIETSINNLIKPLVLNKLQFNDGNSGFNPFYGNTKQIQYFDSALTDSELETLTSWVSFSDMANGQLYTIE